MPFSARRHSRRWLVFSSTLALAALATAACLALRGAGASLQLAEERLSADVVVLPAGTAANVGTALLMGGPVYASMPESNVQRIAAIAGVAAVSPQLYLFSPPQDAPPAPTLLLVACDPASEPALRPWLSGAAPGSLAPGAGIGGSRVAPLAGDDELWLCGSPLRLAGRLAPTGTFLDRSLFVSLETAHQVARRSHVLAPRPLEIPLTGISAALVRLRPGSDAPAVAREIEGALPGVDAVLSPDLFADCRRRIVSIGMTTVGGLGLAAGAVVALVLLGRATPAQPTRALAESAALAGCGAALGISLAAPVTYLLRDALVSALRLPMQLPPLASLLALSAGGLACAPIALAAVGRLTRVERRAVTQPGPGPTSG